MILGTLEEDLRKKREKTSFFELQVIMHPFSVAYLTN
jgi:hypothetical protein